MQPGKSFALPPAPTVSGVILLVVLLLTSAFFSGGAFLAASSFSLASFFALRAASYSRIVSASFKTVSLFG